MKTALWHLRPIRLSLFFTLLKTKALLIAVNSVCHPTVWDWKAKKRADISQPSLVHLRLGQRLHKGAPEIIREKLRWPAGHCEPHVFTLPRSLNCTIKVNVAATHCISRLIPNPCLCKQGMTSQWAVWAGASTDSGGWVHQKTTRYVSGPMAAQSLPLSW